MVWFYPEDGRPAASQELQYVRNGDRKRVGGPADLLNYAIWDLHALVAKRTRDFLLLHAAAVARGGGAVLLPAPPESGKSSLSIALLGMGFEYLSDELGAIDPVTGRIYPYPKRIWVTDGSLDFFPGLKERLQDRQGLSAELLKRYVQPEDVGAAVGSAAPVRLVVFPTDDHQGSPRLARLSRAETVHQLAANTFNLPIYGERGLERLSRIAQEAQAFRLDGGTPRERAASIAELVT